MQQFTNLTDEEILDLIIEEASEVIQAATKIKRFGRDNYNPDTKVNNTEALFQEGADLRVVLKMFYHPSEKEMRARELHKIYKMKERGIISDMEAALL